MRSDSAPLLEQYKVYVATAENVSAMGEKVGGVFIDLNTTLVVVSAGMHSRFWVGSPHIAMVVLILLLNILWFLLMTSYKKLNSAKFKVIHELEKKLSYRCFIWEECFYRQDNRKDFTAVERWIPVVFCLLWVVGACARW